MYSWFYNPEIQFNMWDFTHLLTIIIGCGLIIFIFLFRIQLLPYRRAIRLSTGILLVLSRISLDIWYINTGMWDIKSSLPFELCSISSLACAVMLFTKSHRLFEVFYFLAVGGAIQAIITPDLFFGFPQFRYIQFFVDHFMLLLAPLLMIWLYHFTITLKSLLKAFITINVIAAIVFIINHLLSANYMFLRSKPSGGSLLDFLGPYPWYLLSLEAITLGIFFLLYLPFLAKKVG